MATAKTRKAKSVSLQSAVHCWKTYDFVITSSTGHTLIGQVTMPPDSTEAETTRAVMFIYAKESHKKHIAIDPFNAQIIIKRT
jgi:hypothetical protein